MGAALQANIRRPPNIKVGVPVYSWRDNTGWTGSGVVKELDDQSVYIFHNGTLKSAKKYRVRIEPQDQDRMRELHNPENENDQPSGEQLGSQPQQNPAPTEDNLAAHFKKINKEDKSSAEKVSKSDSACRKNTKGRKQRTEVDRLTEENQNLLRDVPPKRISRPIHNLTVPHKMTEDITDRPTKLSQLDRESAYVN